MKFKKIIISITLIACVLYTCVFGYKKISNQKNFSSVEYKGILTMWHIDSFDGGVGSRRQFLLSTAKAFEKENSGVYVMVINHTVESANAKLGKGELPDMISYGVGVNVKNPKELNIKQDVSGGKINGKTYSVCWCRGGYALITNKKLPNNNAGITIAEGKNNMANMAYLQSGLEYKNVEILEKEQAFQKFVCGKTTSLVATQREIVRLQSRNMNLEITPIEGFNDLLQYLSILTSDKIKYDYSHKFIEYLMQEKVQRDLYKLNLMSYDYTVKFDIESINELQKVNNFKTISAFLGSDMQKSVKQLSIQAVSGDKESLLKLKNMLI